MPDATATLLKADPTLDISHLTDSEQEQAILAAANDLAGNHSDEAKLAAISLYGRAGATDTLVEFGTSLFQEGSVDIGMQAFRRADQVVPVDCYAAAAKLNEETFRTVLNRNQYIPADNFRNALSLYESARDLEAIKQMVLVAARATPRDSKFFSFDLFEVLREIESPDVYLMAGDALAEDNDVEGSESLYMEAFIRDQPEARSRLADLATTHWRNDRPFRALYLHDRLNNRPSDAFIRTQADGYFEKGLLDQGVGVYDALNEPVPDENYAKAAKALVEKWGSHPSRRYRLPGLLVTAARCYDIAGDETMAKLTRVVLRSNRPGRLQRMADGVRALNAKRKY